MTINNFDCAYFKRLPILGKGRQGTVYKISEHEALKVMNGDSTSDDLQVARKMSKLSLKRFVRPYEIKHKGSKVKSYKMRHFHNDNTSVIDISLEKLISELKLIRKDVGKLSASGIRLSDVLGHNIAVEKGKILIYDFSCYTLSNSEYLSTNNNQTLNDYFGNLCLTDAYPEHSQAVYENVYKKFILSGESKVEDFYQKEVASKKKSLREYFKSFICDER